MSLKMKIALTVAATLALTALPKVAQAYFVATVNGSAEVSSSAPTHILVSGRGENLGTQPQMSALGVAARIRQAHPGEQVLLMSVFENDKNRKQLENLGVKFIKVDDKTTFNTSSIMPELLKFKKIASLHFFGHNSPTLGTQSDGLGQRFDFRSRKVADLKGHFTEDGYLFIHGCNGGWILAPMLSNLLSIPVAGAFTGTHFERLHEDQNFYVASDSRAPTPNWARGNQVSFDNERACSYGGCLRMRPTNSPYHGHWGNLRATGLGFYKFFCVGLAQAKCDRVMARSLLNSLTPANLSLRATRNQYIEAAKDFVCPPSRDRSVSNDCAKAMDRVLSGGEKTYSSFGKTPSLQCTFASCEAKFSCTDLTCTLERTGKTKATTQAEEFLAYVRGFDELSKAN
jgi:hypothetical protein